MIIAGWRKNRPERRNDMKSPAELKEQWEAVTSGLSAQGRDRAYDLLVDFAQYCLIRGLEQSIHTLNETPRARLNYIITGVGRR